MAVASPVARPGLSRAGLASLGIVYVGWSSTYLAIRFAVREGSGFPPFVMAGSRALVAGLIMLGLAALFRQRLRPGRAELVTLAIAGPLLWFGGNGLVGWAEQRAASGFAALLIASTPIWVALMEALLDRRPPSALLAASLVVGLLGVAALAGPTVLSGSTANLLAVLALIVAPICWGGGSLLQGRRPTGLGPLARASWLHLTGAVALVVAALVTGESAPAPSTEAWLGWGFLVIFGSVVTFTAYVQALRLLPTSIVFTYAYVNPFGAVILGALILDEEISPATILGAGLVLLGVAGVFRARTQSA